MTLDSFFGELARRGRMPAAHWPAGEDPERYGLRQADGWLEPLAHFQPLRPDVIRQALSGRSRDWLCALEVFPCIGSTNVELVQRARHASVDGMVCLAEIQIQGRGRRGRSWTSPFGANLAVSMGMALARPPAALAGVSLVVGLAVVDALDQLGVPDAQLKWPNDVLRGRAKLGGILIEMSQLHGTELIIGIGLNVSLPAGVRTALGREVADLADLSPPPDRNRLAARVVSSVRDFVAEFETLGFEPFKAAFAARHYHQGKECDVLLGERRVRGVVLGLTDEAELILETPEGPRTFNSGEVSLREGS